MFDYSSIKNLKANSSQGSNSDQDAGDESGGPDGFRYKPDGLTKQSFSITTSLGHHLHLISYLARSDPHAPALKQPSRDPALRHIHPPKGMYPDSAINEPMPVTPVGGCSFPYGNHQHNHHQTSSDIPYSASSGHERSDAAIQRWGELRDESGSYRQSTLPADMHLAVRSPTYSIPSHPSPQQIQTTHNGYGGAVMPDYGSLPNGHGSSPMVRAANHHMSEGDTTYLGSTYGVKPTVMTDLGRQGYPRQPSSSTVPSPASDQKSQDISPLTPSHPSMAISGSKMGVDPIPGGDAKADGNSVIMSKKGLSIGAIVNEDNMTSLRAADINSLSAGPAGKVQLGAQDAFRDTLGFSEDMRALRQLNTTAFP